MNVVVSSDSADGARTAAQAPCRARAANSVPGPSAAPPSAEAAANPTRPIMKVLLRPTRSAIRPPRRSRPPKDREYAVITHCRFASDMPSPFWTEGRAMFTIVPSRITMS
ncbi:hypothetical protein SCALM49S_06432 [Streptomyces californicus]